MQILIGAAVVDLIISVANGEFGLRQGSWHSLDAFDSCNSPLLSQASQFMAWSSRTLLDFLDQAQAIAAGVIPCDEPLSTVLRSG